MGKSGAKLSSRRPGRGARAYRILSSINPLIFLAVYLVLVLGFAIMDWWVASDPFEQHYYAPYAKRAHLIA